MRVFQKINVGDPDMLTIGGLRSMQQADVILYDCLVTKEVRTNTAIYQTLAFERSCRLWPLNNGTPKPSPFKILDLARRDAEMVCVGKKPGGAEEPNGQQQRIHELLIRYAREGKLVCRWAAV